MKEGGIANAGATHTTATQSPITSGSHEWLELTHNGLASIHHHEGGGRVPDKRPRLDLRKHRASALLVSSDGLLLQDMVAPELLADLPEGHAEAERSGDIKCAELQAEPSKWGHWLEDESVDLDDGSEQKRHG